MVQSQSGRNVYTTGTGKGYNVKLLLFLFPESQFPSISWAAVPPAGTDGLPKNYDTSPQTGILKWISKDKRAPTQIPENQSPTSFVSLCTMSTYDSRLPDVISWNSLYVV
jgi:hypothetical protein